MHDVPARFRQAPFLRSDALAAGLTRGVLQGARFRRLHHGVYCFSALEMTFLDAVAAARLALPDGARTTGITRLQELGLDVGPRSPLHFVVEGDHHLALDGVFLHRTAEMPSCDGAGVSVEPADVAFCAEARALDAIKIGCELLRRGWFDLHAVEHLLTEQRWRRGVAQATWVLPHLDHRCRSLPEAELLALLRFSGLPEPEVNAPMSLPDGGVITPDFWYARWCRAVEYEGGQHQEDRAQYTVDIERYAAYRRLGADYVQVTKELLRLPRTTVRRVHRLLVEGGYDGPPPVFGPHWQSLFGPIRDVPRRPQRRR